MSVPPNDASYPTGPPKTAFERVIHSLDQESFNSLRYAYIDALLTFSLFSTKRESPRIWRPVVLENAFSTGKDIPKVLGITKEEGVLVCRMFKDSIPNDHPTRESCAEAALGVAKKFPRLFEEMDVEMMTHLLLRYFLLYSTESLVSFRKIEKIPDADEDDTTFEFGPGLKAIKHIPTSTYILTANGSFSSNEVDAGVGGPFVIHVRTCLEPGAGEGAASEETQRRLILGPMEFAIVNHDCKPNCQIVPVPDSRAYTLKTLRDIQEGENLTICRGADGLLKPPAVEKWKCRCSSCRPEIHPPRIIPRNPPKLNAGTDTGTGTDASTSGEGTTKKRKKRTYRAGRAFKRMKLAIEHRQAAIAELEEGEVVDSVKDGEKEVKGG